MQVDPIWPFEEILFNQEMLTISTSLSSLSEQTIEKLCHFPLKLPSKPEIILWWQLTFQMGAWRQIILIFFANFPVSCCRVSNRPFHPRLKHFLSVTFLWLVHYFCRTWIHVLHNKHPLRIYCVLNWIFLMKRGKEWRNQLNWKIDPDRCHAIFTS